MKRNSFYILGGVIALVEVAVFWLSVQIENAVLIQAAFILGVTAIYWARKRVEDRVEDERTAMITEKAALRTLEVFWVVFFAISLGSAVTAFSRPLGLRPPHPGPTEMAPAEVLDLPIFGNFALVQMGLLCLMIFLYVGFRVYYARKYGDWDTDEEQD